MIDTELMTSSLADPLLALVPENGVLGLGEPTHGSANAFAAKMELVLELARRGLLSTFAVEESYALGLLVDEALRGEGDLEAAWDQATTIWKTTAIIDGLRALQTLNRSLPPECRVAFLGIDIRKPHLAAKALLERGDELPSLQAVARCEDLEEPARLELIARARELGTSGDPTGSALARQILRWLQAYRDSPSLPDLHLRDTFMAATVLEQRPRSGLTALWAHNEHVAINPDFYGGPAMGHVLAEQLGEGYAALGMLCGEGTCRAVDPSSGDEGYRSVVLPPVLPGSTEAALAKRGDPLVLARDFWHPGPRRFLGWKVDTSLSTTGRGDMDLRRPSSDFTAIAYLPSSVADTDWVPTR